jgi:hypothetical protein
MKKSFFLFILSFLWKYFVKIEEVIKYLQNNTNMNVKIYDNYLQIIKF